MWLVFLLAQIELTAPKPAPAPKAALVTKVEPKSIARNAVITIHGLKPKETYWLKLADVDETPSATATANRTAAFTIPDGTAAGDHQIEVLEGKQKSAARLVGFAPDALQVIHVDAYPKTKITIAAPQAVVFPRGDQDEHKYDLILAVDGMTARTSDTAVLFDGIELRDVNWGAGGHPPIATLSSSRREIKIEGMSMPPGSSQVSHELRLRVADGEVSNAVTIGFAQIAERKAKLIAMAMVLLLALVVGAFGLHAGATAAPLAYRMLVDSRAPSYSLSKLQFFLWTAAALFAYCYYTLVRVLVQGVLEFPALPSSLPAIMAISIGTGVAATAISSVKGPKGAGDPEPVFADFISVGGLIAAERVQFLVWTLVGFLTFLFIIYRSDPFRLSALPEVPDSFLALMGLSAAGYVGGKVVRKAGPVIDSVVVSNGSLVVEVLGSGLSPDAQMSIGDVPVSDLVGRSRRDADVLTPSPAGLEVLRWDESKKFAARIRAHLGEPTAGIRAAFWAGYRANRPLRLKITNPDGQSAEKDLPLEDDALEQWFGPRPTGTQPRPPEARPDKERPNRT